MIVRCIDNTLQRDVLVVGREYEVRAERDDCKTRFAVVMPSPQGEAGAGVERLR